MAPSASFAPLGSCKRPDSRHYTASVEPDCQVPRLRGGLGFQAWARPTVSRAVPAESFPLSPLWLPLPMLSAISSGWVCVNGGLKKKCTSSQKTRRIAWLRRKERRERDRRRGMYRQAPPEWSRRITGLRVVESLWGGNLGRAKEAGEVEETRGREKSPGAGGEHRCLQSGGEIVRFI